MAHFNCPFCNVSWEGEKVRPGEKPRCPKCGYRIRKPGPPLPPPKRKGPYADALTYGYLVKDDPMKVTPADLDEIPIDPDPVENLDDYPEPVLSDLPAAARGNEGLIALTMAIAVVGAILLLLRLAG